MAISDLFLSILETEKARQELDRLEAAFDTEGVRAFWESEGWRIPIPKPCKDNRVPLWVLLDAYQLAYTDNLILFDMLNGLKWFYPDEERQADREQIDDFIADTKAIFHYMRLLDVQGWSNSKKFQHIELTLLDYQMSFADIIRLETDRDAARRFMYAHNYPQKKEVVGFLKPEFMRMDMEQGNADAAMPDAALDRKAGTSKAIKNAEQHIKDSGRYDWRKEEYYGLINALYPDYHTKLAEAAWARLPEVYKAGRGRPKKK